MPLPDKMPSSKKGKKTKEKNEKRILAHRYTVVRRLGSGNFGTAWIVEDQKVKDDKDTFKVLKEIPVGEFQPDETIDAVHEASLLRNLNHPGIVKFYDSFIDNNFFCIITEYCEGGDLDQKIAEARKKKCAFSESQVMEWVVQLLLALQYMHERRVLHRDLKTRNIFLRNNLIKVGDFGISRILMGTTDMASTFVGTPYYMSPEVLKHEGYNSKSDVWSIGCILFELCSLKHAFEGQSLMGVMYKIVECEIPEWPSKYSSDAKQVFENLLIKDPNKRPSASEALKLPFIAAQMKELTTTMKDKGQQRESVNRERQQIFSDLKCKTTISKIKQESEAKKLRNMTPRERMRLKKQQEADKQAEKLKVVALQQQFDNQIKYAENKRNMDPFETHFDFKGTTRERVQEKGPDFIDYRTLEDSVREESDEESEDSDEDEAANTVVPARPSQSNQPLNPDERPITPMKDTLVYDVEHSSLDFQDDFERDDDDDDDDDDIVIAGAPCDDDDDDNEGTLVAGDEKEDLINCMQNALNMSDTIQSQTLTENEINSAFGPVARNHKIKNLKADATSKMGAAEFERAYDYLKAARFSQDSKNEETIMKGLSKIVENPNDCFIVDQLLFLEAQAELPS